MLKYLIIFLLVFGIFACAKKEEPSKTMNMVTQEMQEPEGQMNMAEHSKVDGAVPGMTTVEEIGKEVVCPVMGTKFKVKANTEVVDYNDKRYYFCCGGCPGEFKNNPDKYTKQK